MHTPLTKLLFALPLTLTCLLFVSGCDGASADPSMNLNGSEQEPLISGEGPDATLSCPARKVLICHIPPGNPANAHTICVGQPAVKAHVARHSDLLGACASGSPAPAPLPNPVVPAPADAGGAPQIL